MNTVVENKMPEKEVKNLHRGRYNEPGADGKDIYGIGKKAKEHMKAVKNTSV